MRRAALAVLALLTVAGCSDQPATQEPAAPAAVTSAAEPTRPSAERSFLAILDQRGVTSTLTDDQMLQIGRAVCTFVPILDRASVVESITQQSTRGNIQAAEIIVDAAKGYLCPSLQYATTAAVPSGPRTSFTTGTYEVGVDIQPGRYRSPGGTDCYWARLDQDQEILDNNLSSGPTVFDVRESDGFIELNRCTWTLAE